MTDTAASASLVPVLGGSLRLVARNGWSREADDAVRAGGFDALELRGGKYADLDVLAPHAPTIRSLIVESEIADASALGRLDHLVNLTLNAKLDKRFDFTSLKALAFVNVNAWQPYLAASLFRVPTLRALRIEGYDGTDCRALAGLAALQRLTLAKGKLKSLAGIGACANLQALELAHLRALADISELAACKGLRELELSEALPGLADVAVVERLSQLRRLDLRGVNVAFDDVGWLRDFRDLRVLGVANVGAADWDALFASPALKKLFVRFAKAPGVSADQVRQIALDRGLGVTDVQAVGKPNKPLGFVLEFRPPGSKQNLWFWDDAKE